jgi:hypothetical protein
VLQINRHFDLLVRVCRADILPQLAWLPAYCLPAQPDPAAWPCALCPNYVPNPQPRLPDLPTCSCDLPKGGWISLALLFPKIILLLRE